MHRRQPLPRLWMMTDERQGDRLLAAICRMPTGSGIVFRHYSLARPHRAELFRRVADAAARRGNLLMLGGNPADVLAWGADGFHGFAPANALPPNLLRSIAVHNGAELVRAERAGADFLFASPVFPTRSHPDALPLGPVKLGLLIREATMPVIALGGMNEKTAKRLRPLNLHGWAAIDAWDV